ncbi:hypothetical protein ACFGW6_04800, partial [Pasteurella multocida]
AMYSSFYGAHLERDLVLYSQSKFGQMLMPCPHSLIIHGKDGVFRRVGILPERYECTMVGISPRQIITISGEQWMIIPSAQFDASNADEVARNRDHSGIQGVAYRIIE